MKYIVVFLVFAMAEITIGEARTCQQCTAIGKSDCTGQSVSCPNKHDVCANTIEQNVANGELKSVFSRRCLNKRELCRKILSANSTGIEMIQYNDCCYTNNCNKGPIKMPKKKPKENGYYCLSCFTVGSNRCIGDHKLFPCTGNERDCFVFTGKATIPGEKESTFYNSGCITEGACDYVPDIIVGTKVHKTSSIRCSAAQRARKRYLDQCEDERYKK
uniref:Sodefrin-like factor A n=1 Tax=Hyloscirtus phyllognathus TaxID=371702 RepID=A0A513ZV64_9NEOB|nr:sodefrin precursor-like factor A [Hyloscirtus phyllognathus]